MTSDRPATHTNDRNGSSRRRILKHGALLAGAGFVGLPAFTGSVAAHGCAFTPGYWKNHPEAWMPVAGEGDDLPHIHFSSDFGEGPGSQKAYYFTSPAWLGMPSCIEILHMPTKGDKSIIMAQHFIAAILNGRNDTKDWCIRGFDRPSWMQSAEYTPAVDYIRLAREYFDANPVGSGASSWEVDGKDYEYVKDKLEAYNEGRLCVCGD